MQRHSVIVRNILAKFIQVANELSVPVFVDRADDLYKDENFPRIFQKVDKNFPHDYLQVDFLGGLWHVSVVRPDDGYTVVPIMKPCHPRSFHRGLSTALDILKAFKRKGQ